MKLFKSTAIVSGLTFGSRIFGLVRESIMFRVFGVSAVTDAFGVAFRLPNMLRQLFSEGSFATAFVPVLTQYKETRTPEEKQALINHVAGTLAAILLVVSAAGVLFAPAIVHLVAPGFWKRPEQAALTTDILRVTFPYIFFVSMCGLSAGILNTHRRFVVPALTPILLNIAMILGALAAHRFGVPIMVLAWSVILGGLLQLLVQIPALMKLGLMPKPRWGWHHEGVQRVIKLMVPTMFGASVAQVNLLVDIIIATSLAVGSVSWLGNADRLLQFPQGVFGVALSAVILPHLSGKFANSDSRGFAQSLDWALRTALIIAVPATLSLVILSDMVIWTVFGSGKYTLQDAHMAGLSLAYLALGLPAFIAVKVLAPGFFARQDTRTPVKAAIASMLSNIGFNAVIVGSMVASGYYAAHAGLSIASALSGFLNAGLLFYWLRKSSVLTLQPGWRRFLIQLAIGALILSLLLVIARWYGLTHGFNALRTHWRFAYIMFVLGICGVAYLATLWITGLNPKQMLDRGEPAHQVPPT